MKKTENIKTLSFIKNWEQISELETSLNKILRTKANFNLTQDSLEILLNGAKTLMKFIDAFKHQQKQYKNLEQSYAMMQNKLSNHETIIANFQKSYADRIKSLVEESRSLRQQNQKLKKAYQDSQDQNRTALNGTKAQISKLEQTIKNLEQDKQSLIEQRNNKDKELHQKNLQIQHFKNSILKEWEEQPSASNMQSILTSNLAAKILCYLNPYEICQMKSLNKKTRLFVLKSKGCGLSLNKSILEIKNRKISYFHKHIQYFEKLANKIPEEILQTTFYQYHIAKQPMGTQIMSILNSSALIFEGKFMDVDINEGTDSKNQQNSFNKIISQAESNYLQVEKSIIDEYIEQKKNAREKSLKEMDLMYKKIQSTAQLYSADVQSIGLFLKNVLKSFSKVFVLSKNMYSQARNLQCLNTFLLDQLVRWDKSDIKYTNNIEDLKAELDAEKKLKLFFTQKSYKSQQKALAQQNWKLNIEMKYNQTLKNIQQLTYEKKLIEAKLEETEKNLKQANNGNKELRKAYQAGKKKHNEIIQQLTVVKETIIRMNLV